MGSAGPSDVDVLDDLLHDAHGEGEDFEDAEAFFDTDAVQDGEGLQDADAILSQLDAVTNLDEDEAQVDNSEEFHDSTSAPSSPMSGNDAPAAEKISTEGNTEEQGGDSISQDPDQPASPTGEDVIRAVLDLATNANAEDLSAEYTNPAANEVGAGGHTEKQESPFSDNVENEETLQAGMGDLAANGIGEESNADTGEALDMPVPPLTTQNKEDAVPPPAPTAVSVIVGSMNPVEDDNDDSDESQGEEDGENTPLPPPLQLDTSGDEDEDVLEVNQAVVSSLQIEENQRLSMRTQAIEQQAPETKPIEDNSLLKALPDSKVDDMSEIDLSFGEEVRVAHVTTLEPSSPFSDIHKMAGGIKSSQPSADTFGISYQSMRKKDGEQLTSEKEGNYSLPSGPAFPDEREFENEMELTSDLSFSVATAVSSSPSKGGANADDDEFSFDIKPAADSSTLSEDVLKARRESLEAKKRKDEEELLEELKRATDEEKRLLEIRNEAATPQVDSTTAATNEAVADSDRLSLTELHSMYKRGLGDQGVLIDEENEKKGSTKGSEGSQAAELGRSTSVMGRIFSQTHGATETIAEEADEDDIEAEGNAESSKADDENADDTKTATEKSDVGEAEWREIKLVQHRQSQECEGSESGTTAKDSNISEAMSVSRMSYAEAAGYYAETSDVMQHRDIIVSEDFPRGSCLTCLSRPRLTFAGAIEERDRVFCIAATAFDAHNDVVVGVLQTIYRKITKSPRDVLLIGRHWEDIGFQGADPSTDLRGCGVLSLLQILYLVESYPDLANRFHALSQHPTRHFPFACVLINITLQCVVTLRSGALYPECNKHSSVLSGMNRLYVALASQLHDSIQSRSDEIPLILKDVLDRGRSHPTKVIDETFDGSALRPPRPATAPSKTKALERKEDDKNLEFTEIGLQSVDEE